MAKRKQLFHPEEVKKKIQASQLINRLQQNALSEEENMTPGQIKSAETLLDRVVPKLASTKHEGSEPDGSIGITFKTVLEK